MMQQSKNERPWYLDWCEVHEAAGILSENSGHTISPDYVRLLAGKGKINSMLKPGHKRMKVYERKSLYQYTVKGKGPNRKKPEVKESAS